MTTQNDQEVIQRRLIRARTEIIELREERAALLRERNKARAEVEALKAECDSFYAAAAESEREIIRLREEIARRDQT